ncbi:DUF2007 domain-containing protein [Robertkochia flava]|uniref:DUF2007 domain-containing protein n=1 Tax=Robertkochia flava TaxID=3447986 RepID=UPI001CCD85FD|nr:DUF2007 domain-containing protein [Robertkochia marina]
MTTDSYTHLFTGNQVQVMLLMEELKKFDIIPVTRNESESGRLAGFAPPVFNQIQVFIHKDEMDKSRAVLDNLQHELDNIQREDSEEETR